MNWEEEIYRTEPDNNDNDDDDDDDDDYDGWWSFALRRHSATTKVILFAVSLGS